MRLDRSCGVLLHPTSLPGRFGCGDLGPGARRFVDWLAQSGGSWWQMLPLNPPSIGLSPYLATSTFAGNPLLISPRWLFENGLLGSGQLVEASVAAKAWDRVDVSGLADERALTLRRAFERFSSPGNETMVRLFDQEAEHHAGWLPDYCRFAAAREVLGQPCWKDWPEELRRREPKALEALDRDAAETIAFHRFCQLAFFLQLAELAAYARDQGIGLIGDLPIYVALDSADVWAHPELFKLDGDGNPTFVAGVPPDYFSEDGQLWGNPVYDWSAHEAEGFSWWCNRLEHASRCFDLVRLDHFRGFAACWEVPAHAESAMAGAWVETPGSALFEAVEEQLGSLPFIAEDLGVITEDVEALRDELALPGMSIAIFGFEPHQRSEFVPYRQRPHQVVYSGTHDSNTVVGWFSDEATPPQRDFFSRYLKGDGHEPHWDLIRACMASPAELTIFPAQDLLGLGSEARMNVPGEAEGNWDWRLRPGQLGDIERYRLAELAWLYGRAFQQD